MANKMLGICSPLLAWSSVVQCTETVQSLIKIEIALGPVWREMHKQMQTSKDCQEFKLLKDNWVAILLQDQIEMSW